MGSALLSSWGSASALIGLGWIDGELSEELSGAGIDHPHVEVIDEDKNAGSRVGSADPDLDELPVVADRDLACGVDSVTSNSVVPVSAPFSRRCLGTASIGDARRGALRQR